MIIRKPFAFLIKNFKKIHIVLLLLSLFVAYKIIDVNLFVNDFMKLGAYDLYADPISNHISLFMLISVVLLSFGSFVLVILLKYKNKPWKTYLIPLIVYVSLFLILNMIKSFFKTYTIDVETTDLRFSRDLLVIFVVLQLPAIAIFFMRTFALDIGKFNFNSDKEFLELSDEDREEIEINFDIDINTFKRVWRRAIRNIRYFYLEHKGMTRLLFVIIILILGYNLYNTFFVINKVYKEGELYNYNGFVIKVKDTYITDKDYNGKVISNKSNFLILNLSVENLADTSRKFDTSNLHIKAANYDYITTETTYSSEFSDLGKSYSKVKSIKSGENLNFIIIYKVDKKINSNRFVLFYQEKNILNKLRKIKLKITDLSKIKDSASYNLGDFIDLNLNNKKESISFDSYQFTKSIEYNSNDCGSVSCELKSNFYQAGEGSLIFSLEFASDSWEAKNMIDFLSKYGKIEYKDSSGKMQVIDELSVMKKNYFGKVAYIIVPEDVSLGENIKLHFIVRNNNYIYSIS